MAFWLHRIDVEEPGSPAHPPAPAMEQIRRVIQGWLEKALAPVAATLHRCGASANQVSAFGFALSLAAAALVMTGDPVPAGMLYLLAGVLDLLDGILARSKGTPTRFGAFLDSTLDRASEGVVFAAVGYRLAIDGSPTDAGVVVLALLGSFLVSYVRARGEALGARCNVGVATRAERVVLLGAGLLAGLLAEAIYLLALLTAITVVQRFVRVRRQLLKREAEPELHPGS